jgi:hypothetical protein
MNSTKYQLKPMKDVIGTLLDAMEVDNTITLLASMVAVYQQRRNHLACVL